MNMCVDMCVDMCVQMCMDMRMHLSIHMSTYMYTHILWTRVCTCLYTQVQGTQWMLSSTTDPIGVVASFWRDGVCVDVCMDASLDMHR